MKVHGEEYIEFEYPEEKEISEVFIKTTKPVTEGRLVFEHIKTIQKEKIENYEKGIKQNFKRIIPNVSINGQEAICQNAVQLTEPFTKADLALSIEGNKSGLMTTAVTDVTFEVTLRTNNFQYDLYKNPVLQIELPEGIEEISNVVVLDDETIKTCRRCANKRKKNHSNFSRRTNRIHTD